MHCSHASEMRSTSKNPKKRRRRRSYGRVFKRVGGPGWLVQFPDPSGRKVPSGRTAYVTRAVASRAEGEQLLREVRKAQLTGTLASPTASPSECDLSVVECIDAYVEAKKGAGLADSTAQIYGYSRTAIDCVSCHFHASV